MYPLFMRHDGVLRLRPSWLPGPGRAPLSTTRRRGEKAETLRESAEGKNLQAFPTFEPALLGEFAKSASEVVWRVGAGEMAVDVEPASGRTLATFQMLFPWRWPLMDEVIGIGCCYF